MKFYKCNVCGNLVEMVKASGNTMTCCGRDMVELIPGTSDGAPETHIPVCTVTGNKITVNVGEKDHPMMDNHYIEWIVIETDKGAYRINLKPGAAPKAEMVLADDEKVVGVYAYCSRHGLWTAEKK